MNLKSILSISMLLVTTLFIGCSKDDDNNNGNNPGNNNTGNTTGTLSAKIDGVAWTPSADSSAATMMQGNINITGVASNGRTITITVMDTIPGTYDLSPVGMEGAGVYQTMPTSGTNYNSNYGPWTPQQNTITFSSIDLTNKKMTGTFKFMGMNTVSGDTVSVSDGVFTNLPFTTSITSTGNNSFAVNINGSAFTPGLISGNVAGGNINITASGSTGLPSVGLMFPSNTTPGTYSLQPFGTYNALYNSSSSQYMLVDAGTLTITEHNTVTKKIVGTFSFTASEFGGGGGTANLTGGSFTIFYN